MKSIHLLVVTLLATAAWPAQAHYSHKALAWHFIEHLWIALLIGAPIVLGLVALLKRSGNNN
jgi:hypothetical protein